MSFLQDRPGKRRGSQRLLRALRHSGHQKEPPPVDVKDYRLRGAPVNDLDKLDWPEKVKKMQTDWIGKSYGAELDFPIDGREEKITVYTTRPDTLYGATFMVLAPEHPLAKSLATDETREAVENTFSTPPCAPMWTGCRPRKRPRIYRKLCNQPVKRGQDTHLAVRLRTGGLRYRRDHVRTRP